ncbi:MAG TPA: ABC transporter permease [Methylomirabilota bacterium]|jgi:peptide/nickel transport system permease protein|nr:ABC transporter permease [Methylomirabilota bacterium]
MIGYVVRRLLFLVLVLFGMSLVTFVVSHAIPADPARLLAGLEVTQDQVESVRREFGLDRPLPEQYVRFLGGLLRGDLGQSLSTRRPVRDDLEKFFPATLELGLAATGIALVIGIPFGVFAAVRHGKWVDHGTRMTALAGAALPVFWSGLMLQLVFYRHLGWLPAGGRLPQGQLPPALVTGLYTVDALLAGHWSLAWVSARHLAMPALALSGVMLAGLARMVRSSLLDVLREDYIRTARAKGVAERLIVLRHAMRNALIPVLTVFGLQFGHLLGGAVLTETVFFWPGVGAYAVRAVTTVDFPAIMGAAMLLAAIYVVVNLLVDLSYTLIDPRIRY